MASEILEQLGFTLEIVAPVFSTGLNFNTPILRLFNNSTSASILGFDITIGDTNFNFDEAVNDFSSVISLIPTLNTPDRFGGGEIRSDNINYSFTGFTPGEFFQFDTDIDIDDVNSDEDFRQVLFDLNGTDSSDNALVTVNFSDGTTLSGQLPDFSQAANEIYSFSQSTAATLGYELEFSTLDFNQPWMKVTNTSSTESITDFTLTIGDDNFNFDAVAVPTNQSPGIFETLLTPDNDFEGGVRSDTLTYNFNGFGPGKFFQAIDVDFDQDDQDSFEDYRRILFDLNGADSSDNAVVTVTFSNGITLSDQLPDFAQTLDDTYTFGQSIDTDNITVDTLVDENDGDLSPGDVSLREAIAFIADGGTIEFDPSLTGTITLDSSLGQLLVDQSLTINGSGADVISVSGNNQVRVFRVDDEDSNNEIEVFIDGLTITEGWATGGNFVGDGAGIFNQENLTLTNSVITNNESTNVSGGVFNSGSLLLSDSVISDNVGPFGAGLRNVFGNVKVINSTISKNNAINFGGGIDNFGGTLVVENTTISGNSAGRGGGIGVGGTSSGSIQVIKSTITANTAVSEGGGILNNDNALIFNSIIASNTANTGTDIQGSFSSNGYNLVGNSDGGSGFSNGVNGDQVGTTANPIDPLLAPLADNGGPTLTHALLPNSPAIDAGDPNFTPPPDFDQRGNGFPRVINGRIDIGAYEAPTFLDIGLYDAISDTLIAPLSQGVVIPLSDIPDLHNVTIASIVPENSPFFGQVGSIALNLNNSSRTQTENVTPYALFGDNNGDFNGGPLLQGNNTISFNVFSRRGGRGTLLGTVTRNFTLIDDQSIVPPVVMDDAIQTLESEGRGDVDINVLDNDQSGTGSPIAVVGVAGDGGPADAGNIGAAVGGSNGGLFTINADGSADFGTNGEFEFLSSGETATSSIEFGVGYQDGTGPVLVSELVATVTGENDAPTAVDDKLIAEGTSTFIDVLANDSDPDTSDSLSITSVTAPGRGDAIIQGNEILYLPNVDIFDGTDSFDYTISDGNGGTDTATVSVVGEAIARPLVVNLIDAEADETIAPIGNGSSINIDDPLLVGNLSISVTVAETSPFFSEVESIGINLNNGMTTRIENVEPYSLFGDINGDFAGGNIPLGTTNTIAFELFSENNGNGTLLDTVMIDFTLM